MCSTGCLFGKALSAQMKTPYVILVDETLLDQNYITHLIHFFTISGSFFIILVYQLTMNIQHVHAGAQIGSCYNVTELVVCLAENATVTKVI